VDYIGDLRRSYQVPAFTITSDHVEIGRIQGKQFAALLPKGGSVLYIEGPATSAAAKKRTLGMNASKPTNIRLKSMRANWTEEGSHRAVSSWLRLSTSQDAQISLVGAQDDSMAMGARKAFAEAADHERWLALPFTGCDGMPKTGQAWVRCGLLAATIYVRPNTDLAMEMLVETITKGKALPECELTKAESVPGLAELTAPATWKLGKSARV